MITRDLAQRSPTRVVQRYPLSMAESSRYERARRRLLAALEQHRRLAGIPNRIVTVPGPADRARAAELAERFGWGHLVNRKR